MGEARADEAEARPPRRVALWALPAIVLMLVAMGLTAYWLLAADRPPDDLWAEASYRADPDCVAGSPDCPLFIEPFVVGHGGSGSETALTLYAVSYPGLDDPVAQWGRCMDTVLACLMPSEGAAPAERADALRACVAGSDCPEACRTRFAERAQGDLAQAAAEFETLFVAEDAWCAPVQ